MSLFSSSLFLYSSSTK